MSDELDDDRLNYLDDYFHDDEDQEPPRHSRRPWIITGIFLALIVIIVGGLFLSHTLSGARVFSPTPTPTLVPGSNLFYVQTSPGWGTIAIDGHAQKHLPADPAADAPLALSAGTHDIAWNAAPFVTQHCTLIVPPSVNEENCLANDPVQVQKGQYAGLHAYVITFSASMTNLPAAQHDALVKAAQTALDALTASDTVQPGEYYASLSSANNQYIATATAPLKATMHFQLDTNQASNKTCQGEVYMGVNSCSFNGQDCHIFCSLDTSSSISSSTSWDVMGVINVSWTYTTQSGQVIADNQPDEADNLGNEFLMPLYITWDGAQWHVSTRPGPNAESFVGSSPYCIPAVNFANNNQYIGTNIPTNASTQSVFWTGTSGSNGAAGCLLEATPAQGNSETPVANPKPLFHCLYRFGVLLTLDVAAQRTFTEFPKATSYEQSIAQQIMRQAKLPS
ncbi:MAG TPA: hypothetical protein VFA41_11625 [Ktedonobacteraceae bacterium]|jgi:hypothetical protein|nr:hypothetical protein [Ktedonobacteraceae bacterium]